MAEGPLLLLLSVTLQCVPLEYSTRPLIYCDIYFNIDNVASSGLFFFFFFLLHQGKLKNPLADSQNERRGIASERAFIICFSITSPRKKRSSFQRQLHTASLSLGTTGP